MMRRNPSTDQGKSEFLSMKELMNKISCSYRLQASDLPRSLARKYFFLILLVFLLLGSEVDSNEHTTHGTKYVKKTQCQVDTSIDSGCLSLSSKNPRSLLECASFCQQSSEQCLGVLINRNGNCYFKGSTCSEDLENLDLCTENDRAFTSFIAEDSFDEAIAENVIPESKEPTIQCQNGGTLNTETNLCDCVGGFSGSTCADRVIFPSCAALIDAGYSHDIHTIHLQIGSEVVRTRCEIGPSFVKTYISFNDGSGGYNKTYDEYEKGFYQRDNLFWLGLANMYQLNQQGMDTLVLEVIFTDGVSAYIYPGVNLGDSASGYTVSWGAIYEAQAYPGGGGIPGDNCLPYGIGFYTPDRSWITGGENFALLTNTGWWIEENDIQCNPNGIRYESLPSPTVKFDHVVMGTLNLHQVPPGDKFRHVSFYFYQEI